MTNQQKSSAQQALLQLLAAIDANIPVASGFGGSRAEPSFRGDWHVMDRDCAVQVREAAGALRQAVAEDSGALPAAPVQELLTAIESNQPFATGTGHCPDVPCFDRHDREAESNRPGWEMVYMDRAQRVKKVATALREVLRDGV